MQKTETKFSNLFLLKVGAIFAYTRILTILTRFYPFSMIWKDRIFHFQNKKHKKLFRIVKAVLYKNSLVKDVIFIGIDDYFSTFEVLFNKGSQIQINKISNDAVNNIRKKTKRKIGALYMNGEGNKRDLLIPIEYANSLDY